jgi:methionine-rich copper-binding protein CopC
MDLRRFVIVALACLGGLAAIPGASAQELKVLETGPAANAVLDGVSDFFFVRFNQPVDHVNSRLLIKRGSETVETLQPRLQSNPNVLFARAAGLPAGSYTLHWVVKTLADAKIEQGEVPFSISAPK